MCLIQGGIELCIQFTAMHEVFVFCPFSTELNQNSSNARCCIRDLDSSHPLNHFSPYLYPFQSKHLTIPPPNRRTNKANEQ